MIPLNRGKACLKQGVSLHTLKTIKRLASQTKFIVVLNNVLFIIVLIILLVHSCFQAELQAHSSTMKLYSQNYYKQIMQAVHNNQNCSDIIRHTSDKR